MSTYDWSRFNLRIPISASFENIFKSWCTQRELEKWFLRQAKFTDANNNLRAATEFIQKGDSYEWLWHGWPDTVIEKGKILSVNDGSSLQFAFGKAGIVTVTVYSEQDISICELAQTDIPTNDEGQTYWHIGCTKGWNFYLTNLKSILEGGIDLRNKNVLIENVVNS